MRTSLHRRIVVGYRLGTLGSADSLLRAVSLRQKPSFRRFLPCYDLAIERAIAVAIAPTSQCEIKRTTVTMMSPARACSGSLLLPDIVHTAHAVLSVLRGNTISSHRNLRLVTDLPRASSLTVSSQSELCLLSWCHKVHGASGREQKKKSKSFDLDFWLPELGSNQ